MLVSYLAFPRDYFIAYCIVIAATTDEVYMYIIKFILTLLLFIFNNCVSISISIYNKNIYYIIVGVKSWCRHDTFLY